MSLNSLTLVISVSYEPVGIIPVRRAITLLCKGAAVVEVPSDRILRTGRGAAFPCPSVIRLLRPLPYRRAQNRAVSRKHILLRDRYSCQYCGWKAGAGQREELTLDHVVPRAKGGGNSWVNLVACCVRCNNRKGDRSLAESGMKLLHKPAQIGVHAKHRLMMEQAGGRGMEEWDRFLFC